MNVFCQDGFQTGYIEHEILRIGGFGDSVRIKKQQVTLIQVELLFFHLAAKLFILAQADTYSSGFQFSDAAGL